MARLNHVQKARKSPGSCGRCSTVIAAGDPYYWWKNRAPGQRSGVRRLRCEAHRPRPSEMMPGRRGQLAAIQEEVSDSLGQLTVSVDETGQGDTPDVADFETIAESAADALQEIADEIEEGAQNIEDGFGHETEQSSGMREKAETLSGLADDLRGLSYDEAPEIEEDEDHEDYASRLEAWLEEQGNQITEKTDEAEV